MFRILFMITFHVVPCRLFRCVPFVGQTSVDEPFSRSPIGFHWDLGEGYVLLEPTVLCHQLRFDEHAQGKLFQRVVFHFVVSGAQLLYRSQVYAHLGQAFTVMFLQLLLLFIGQGLNQ